LPLWEITTGITMMMCGVDLFMMLNPISVKTLKEIGKTLTTKPGEVKLNTNNYEWITAKV